MGAPAPANPDRPTEATRRSGAWDLANAPRNYASLLLNQAVSLALAFACSTLATHRLGPQGYGGVAALLAAAMGVTQFAVAWSAPSLVRFGCEEFVRTGALSRTFWTRTVLLAVNVAAVALLAPVWFPPLATWLKLPAELRTVVLVHLALLSFWVHVQFALQGAKLPKLQGALLTLERALVLLGAGALLALDRFTPFTLALAYILAPIAPILVGLIRLRPLIRLPSSFDRAEARAMLRYSLPLLAWGVTGSLSSNVLDSVIVTRFMTRADLGRYAAVYQLTTAAMQVPTLASSLLTPYFVTLRVTGQDALLMKLARTVCPIVAILWSLACGLGALVMSASTGLIFGEGFAGMARVVWPLMAVAAVIGPAAFCYTPLIHAYGRTRIIAVATLASSLTNVVLDLVLIPRLGLPGSAWATLASVAVHTAIFVALLQRGAVPFFGWWQVSVVAPVVLAAGAVGLTGRSSLGLLVCLGSVALAALTSRRALKTGASVLRELIASRRGGAPSLDADAPGSSGAAS